MKRDNLSGQVSASEDRILVVGEVLWDIFEDSRSLGGAPLNFAANARHIGHEVILVSGLGNDVLGTSAREKIEALGLASPFIRASLQFPTGSAAVEIGPNGQTAFRIQRPAAYDAIELSGEDLRNLANWNARWLYYGTLFSSMERGNKVLDDLIRVLPETKKFYDVNLRPDSYSPELVKRLLQVADVVKLNEEEMAATAEFAGLPANNIESFCRAGSRKYNWEAVCVTLGARGCAVLRGEAYAEVEGYCVDVIDTVGAGDGFAAAFLHGVAHDREPADIGAYSNRVGAIIASCAGALPDWKNSKALVWTA